MTKFILYHNDADGIISATIAVKYINDHLMNKECKFVPLSYDNQDSIDIQTFKDQDVYLLDFSFNIDKMNWLAKNTNLIWIDHHKSNKESLAKLWDSRNIKGKRDINFAACELAWMYFYPTKKIPFPISMIADRDIWRWTHKESMPFNEMIYFSLKHPIDQLAFDIVDYNKERINKLIKKGEELLLRKDNIINGYLKTAVPIKFENIDAFAINSTNYISDLGNRIIQDYNVPLGIVYHIEKKGLKISLRSKDDLDVSILAKKYGGGGHKNAAGLILTDKTQIKTFLERIIKQMITI